MLTRLGQKHHWTQTTNWQWVKYVYSHPSKHGNKKGKRNEVWLGITACHISMAAWCFYWQMFTTNLRVVFFLNHPSTDKKPRDYDTPRVTWQIDSGTTGSNSKPRDSQHIQWTGIVQMWALWFHLVISFQLYVDWEKPQSGRGLNIQNVRGFRTFWGWCQTPCWGQTVS